MDQAAVDRFVSAFGKLVDQLKIMQQDPAWMARYNPVAYVALCRAERKGHAIRQVAGNEHAVGAMAEPMAAEVPLW